MGIVTASDLLKSMPKVSETMLWVNEFMTERALTADETTLVSSIVKVMSVKKIGSVVRALRPRSSTQKSFEIRP